MKLFRAVSESIVEALVIRDSETPPTGWFSTKEEAFAAFNPTVATSEEPATMAEHEAPKRRGRPRRAETPDQE